MEILVSTGSLTGIPLRCAFDLARRAGADGVELMLTSRLVRDGPERIQALEHQTGVPVRAVHTVMRLRDPSLERAAEDILISAHFAHRLANCDALVVHLPSAPTLHAPGTRIWFDAIDTALTVTEQGRARIAIENTGRLRRSDPEPFLDHPDRLLRFAQEWGVAITYDTAHAASQGWDVLEVAAPLAPHLANVHLSDYGRRTFPVGLANALLRDHQLPGTGVLPLGDVLDRLVRAGYDGLVTLELSPVALRVPWFPSTERRLAAAIGYCRAAIFAALRTGQTTHHPRRP
ncbi:sugar phosphate isomerase/epimerase [Sphaerobacter sp.]|uniref:sugar phosphate isomerase/epimerase family protein n=1 Tax=Sphaerobacter sp. TaxID=2099654 RepID=UPI001E083721|nr:sugar phosphate isomerase/epimerase [Sphaerobacter sp.]MBX5444369.1 sugar phosphate isomerase/epimerase [Sphaerobacter sp.]